MIHGSLRVVRLATVAVVLIQLSACTSMSGINTNAQTQKANTLNAGQSIGQAGVIAWPKLNWWKAYRDPQLDALIDKTIANSPTLRATQTRIARSQSYADSMHAETLPNINADTSIIRERFTSLQFIPPPWGGNIDWNNKAQLSLAYDLDLWGRQESLWRASVNETQAAAAEAQQVKLELITTIVRNYVQLAMDFRLHDLAVEHQAQLELRVTIARRSLAAGLSTELEVSEAETFLPLARIKIEAINAQINLLRHQIAALAGQDPAAGERITRPDITLDAPVGVPDQLPANLLGRRPDLLAYRWHVEASRQNIESAKAAFYPNINLLAFVGFQSIGFGQMISNAGSIAGAGPAISLPIFDGGRRRSNLSAKTAAYDNAVENYNGALIHALQDVSDQLVVLQSNAKQLTEAQTAVNLASKSYTLAQTAYRAGLSNYLHVLDARIQLIRQQETIAQMQSVRLESYANLMRALGGGVIEDVTKTINQTKLELPR